MAIETTLQPRQKWWNLLYAAICAGLAAWGALDYWVTIPNREAEYHAYEAAKARHEQFAAAAAAAPLSDADKAEYVKLDEEFQRRAAANLPVPSLPPAYDRPVQMWLYIVGCGVLGVPYFLWQWLAVANKRFRLEDDGALVAPGVGRIPADEIVDIDMGRWMSKSIATVKATGGRTVILDDYKFRGTDLIVGAIAVRFYPDDWTPDGRDLKKLRRESGDAPTDGAGAAGGDG